VEERLAWLVDSYFRDFVQECFSRPPLPCGVIRFSEFLD